MRLARPHVGWSALQRPAAFLPQARRAALGPAWAAPPALRTLPAPPPPGSLPGRCPLPLASDIAWPLAHRPRCWFTAPSLKA